MGHHELICRTCGEETPIATMQTSAGGGSSGFICPACGSTSFGV